MLGITKVEPACYGCGKVAKLSKKGMCSWCEWAISQAHDLNAQKLEIEIKTDALKQMDEHIEKELILAEIAINKARQNERDAIKAAGIEAQILVERNAQLRSELIKAYRKIKTLESVTTQPTET